MSPSCQVSFQFSPSSVICGTGPACESAMMARSAFFGTEAVTVTSRNAFFSPTTPSDRQSTPQATVISVLPPELTIDQAPLLC